MESNFYDLISNLTNQKREEHNLIMYLFLGDNYENRLNDELDKQAMLVRDYYFNMYNNENDLLDLSNPNKIKRNWKKFDKYFETFYKKFQDLEADNKPRNDIEIDIQVYTDSNLN